MGKKQEEEDVVVTKPDVEETEEETAARERVIAEAKLQFSELLEYWGQMIFRFYYIGIILKAEKNKDNMRRAMEFMDEQCIVDLVFESLEERGAFVDITVEKPMVDVMNRIHDAVTDFYNHLTAPKAELQQQEELP